MARAVDVPVLVVGAGPSGMVAAILLARLGVACAVVERRDGTQPAPAAHVVNARTFEVLRAAGVDMAAVAAACQDPADGGFVHWTTTLTGELLGSLPFERQGDDVRALTPTPLRNLSQDRLERILADHLRTVPGVEVRHGATWVSAVDDGDGVTSTVAGADGSVGTVRSRWVVAADGAASAVRASLGIVPVGPRRLASFVMVHLDAPWRSLVADRPGVLYFLNSPARGTFVAHDLDRTWVYMHPWDPDAEPAEAFTPERCEALVRAAVGTEPPPFAVRNVATWHMSVQVAERYRSGRTFLVGDAAHRFPPTGGLGLNTGVQDAHALAWRLAVVERGWADEAVLDHYERERRPVAERNAEASARNAARLAEVPQALGRDGAGDRAAVRAAIDAQAEHFDMLGLQLGVSYTEGGVVPDGSAPPAVGNAVREYVPSGRPGGRLPHAWVRAGGRVVSTLDLLPLDRVTLVAAGSATEWLGAAARLGEPVLATLVIGRDLVDDDGAWAGVLGIGGDGALLVRPDQHVAWRSAGPPTSADDELRGALAAVLGRPGPGGPA